MARWLIFMGLLILYITSVGTRLYSSDAQVMYETSRALAFDQTLALPDDYSLPQIRCNPTCYSQYDLGLPTFAAPIVWLSDRIAQHQLWNRYAFAALMVVSLSAMGTALAVSLIFGWASRFYDPPTALLLAVGLGLCTPLWVYGKLFFAEGLLAGLLTLAYWQTWRGGLWLAGLSLGFAILTRNAMLIYLLPLLILAQGNLWQRGKLLIVPALAVIASLWHNHLRTGNLWESGYAGQAFDTPFYEGVLGLLFSLQHGVIFFAPPILMSVVGWRAFARRDPRLAWTLLISAALALILYGSWWAWGGGWSWGPRFLVPLLPLWMLPAGQVIHTTWGKSLLAVGFGVAILGVFTDVTRHFAVYDMVQSPIQSALLSIRDGYIETPAIGQLTGLGWLPLPAVLVPLFLWASVLVILYQIRRTIELSSGHE